MLNRRKIMLFSAGALLIGCSQSPFKNTGDSLAANDQSSSAVIDCLLPGEIRKLGSRATYLMPKRPIKTTHNDCIIRGGHTI
ncbi:MAG: hypothetical protein ACU83N_13975 [Gammaproteobacteria bacterium]